MSQRGKFFALDDFDIAGHRLLNWEWLDDIPHDNATNLDVLSFQDGVVTWLATQETSSIEWDNVLNKPTFVNVLGADSGIELSANTGNVSIRNSGVRALIAGANISISANTGVITVSAVSGAAAVDSVSAGTGLSATTTTGDVTLTNQAAVDQGEPNGFVAEPGSYDSTMTITNNRTFSIEPTGASYDFYVNAAKHTKTSTDTVNFNDVEGLHFFYFNASGTLSVTQTIGASIFTSSALIAVARWNATDSEVIYFGEERHGCTMSGQTHRYLHDTEGTRYVGGHALSDITADGDGSSDAHATLSVESGTIADEDLFLAAAATASATQTWHTYYKTGPSSYWRRTAETNFPIVYNTTNVFWNEYNGTSWVQTAVTNNRYVLSHIFRTNSATVPYIAVQGENTYGNVIAARAGANDEIGDIYTAGMPFVEFSPLATLIYQFSSGYSNTPQARIRTTDTGSDYIDWRAQVITAGSGPSDHGTLGGLGDKDHPTTALQQTSATTGQVLAFDGTDWLGTYTLDGTFFTTDKVAINGATVSGTSIEALKVYGALRATSYVWTNDNFYAAGPSLYLNSGSSASSPNAQIYTRYGGFDFGALIQWNGANAAHQFSHSVSIASQLGVGGTVSTTGTDIAKVTGDARVTSDLFVGDTAVIDYDDAIVFGIGNFPYRGFTIDISGVGGGWERGYRFMQGSTLLFGMHGYGTGPSAMLRLSFSQTYNAATGLHILPSTGRVGIGDNSPSYELDVTGEIRATGDVFCNNDLTVSNQITAQSLVLDEALGNQSLVWMSASNTDMFSWSMSATDHTLSLQSTTNAVFYNASLMVLDATDDSIDISGTLNANTLTINDVDVSRFNACVHFDGGGTYVTSNTKAQFRMPTDAKLVEVSVFADKTDTCTFSVDACTYGGYDTFSDKTGGLDLTLSAAKKSSKTSLTTWNTTFSEGDIVRLTVDTTNTTQTFFTVVFDFERGS